MAAYYGDSSALAKRYVREVGSGWMVALMSPAAANRIYTALVTGAEMVAALARRVRMGSMTAADGEAAIAAFRREFHTRYGIVPVTYEILERAMDLADQHGLRGYDAIQLACALATRDELAAGGVPSLTILSADAALNTAAAAILDRASP